MKTEKITDRIIRLRSAYRNSVVGQNIYMPHSYGNHPITSYWMEGYLKSREEALTTLMRRSYAEVEELSRSKCVFSNQELIVGQPDFSGWLDDKAHFDALWEAYQMSPSINDDGRSDHTALNYEKLLKVGVRGLINEIKAEKAKLDFHTAQTLQDNLEREEFFDASIMELEALVAYAHRYEAELRHMAEALENDRCSPEASRRKSELLTMADNLAHVPEYPAESFWQALQSIHFYTFTLRGLYSLGRPDQFLLPYYRKDIQSGVITPAFAQELIDNFCLLYATYIYSNTAVGLMLGGTDADGNAIENELTWAFLTASDHISMPDPNVGLCITDQTSDEILKYSLEILGRGKTFPMFWNDKLIVQTLIEKGFDSKDAHAYINSTCVELSIIGKSNIWNTSPYHNLAQLLLEVFEQGEYCSYEALETAYFKHVTRAFEKENHRINQLKLERSRNASEAMRHSCLIDDCIKRGKPVGNGGAIYNTTMPNTLGFANAVDSLAAIRQLVFEQKTVSLQEYRNAVKQNFTGYEALRREIMYSVPHYGNDVEEVDAIAVRLADCMREACSQELSFHGDTVIPGVFSFFYHILYGENTPATPDGRTNGQPLSDSSGPMQGRDKVSPTAMLRSAASWQPKDFIGGVALNLKLSSKYFQEENQNNTLALIKGFFASGGVELQINCVSREELEDAMIHPENHENLIVRIGGYSDFFVRMSPTLQKEVLERSDY